MDWETICELEPRLLALEADVKAGKTTLNEIMLTNGLVPLVGRHAEHATLRLPVCYLLAYNTLAALDQRRRQKVKAPAESPV